jgi:alpha/beta superfamily hydrolase
MGSIPINAFPIAKIHKDGREYNPEETRGGLMEEERICFEVTGARIEGLISLDERPTKGSIIICHPHPLFGGSMDNLVVIAIARIAAMWDYTSLRFNFRGVERSTGTFGGGIAEQDDVKGAIDYLGKRRKPTVILVAGYSFGAIACLEMFDFGFLRDCPKPKLFVCGEYDTICPPSKMESFFETLSGPKWLRILPGIDHFFHGKKGLLEGTIGDFLERMVQR